MPFDPGLLGKAGPLSAFGERVPFGQDFGERVPFGQDFGERVPFGQDFGERRF